MADRARILVIEADGAMSRKLIDRLEAEGFKAQAAKNSEALPLSWIDANHFHGGLR